jgi:hypothetical protein
MRRNATVKTASSEPRISVPGDPAVMRKLRYEKLDTGLSYIEIVNARLAKSYEDDPRFPYESISA